MRSTVVVGGLVWVSLPALAGLVMMAAGVRGFFMKRAALRAQRDYREERLRRVQDYRRDDSATDTFDGRREPFISGLAGMPAAQKNPAQRGARAG